MEDQPLAAVRGGEKDGLSGKGSPQDQRVSGKAESKAQRSPADEESAQGSMYSDGLGHDRLIVLCIG